MTHSNAATRHFLGWHRTLLSGAVDHLLAVSSSPQLDLSNVLVVTPGRRAARMLIPVLAEAAHRAGRALTPPNTTTPGDLPSALLKLPLPLAGPLARRAAWARALQSIPSHSLEPLIPRAPEPDRPDRWAALAEPLERASDELAGELLTFADVPRLAPALVDGPESDRWFAAALVQQAYEEVLSSQSLSDTPLACARALAGAVERGSAHVLLVGISELPRAARTAIEHAAAVVDAIIAAPDAIADRFDEFGCIRPDAWRDIQVDISEDRIVFAHGPREQAAHALAALAGPSLRPSDVVFGVPDADVSPHLSRLADRADSLSVRDATGRPLRDTLPARLLLAVADYLERPTFSNLAALVRHPDIEQHLRNRLSDPEDPAASEWWLDRMDKYAEGTLPAAVGDSWPGADDDTSRLLTSIATTVTQLLTPLAIPDRGTSAWAEPLTALLRTVYEGRRRSPRSPTGAQLIDASRALAGAIAELGRLPDSSDDATTAPQAIHLILSTIGSTPIAPPADPGAIEALGWLELPFDPAPVVIVTGMNEESIPGISNADALLPDSLRRALSLSCAENRLARDAFLLTALVASRRRFCLTAGRHGGDDRPLRPSRLLLAASSDTVMARLNRFFVAASSPAPRLDVRTVPSERSAFPSRPKMPPTEPAPIPDQFSVTAFRDYLASPYLFYLKHILKLRARDEAPEELDALSYGALLHHALEAFGHSDQKSVSDPARIADFLQGALSDAVRARFGPNPSALVDLQVGLLAFRLKAFADAQARHRRDGWLIERVEWHPACDGRDAPFDVDGVPARISGRIDRIDRHEDGRRVFILDYKSSKDPETPEKAHESRDGWKNLQLPLYRHLAAELGLPDDPVLLRLGYFAIPRDRNKTGILGAKWGGADLATADETAREVIRKIRSQQFDEPGNPSRDAWVFQVLAGHAFPDLAADGEEEEAE